MTKTIKFKLMILLSLITASSLAVEEKIVLGSKSFENSSDKSQFVYGKLGATRRVNIDSNLNLKLDGLITWSMGREENKFESQAKDLALEINDISLNYRPLNYVTLSAGALAQNESPFLTDSQSFPALRQELSIKNVKVFTTQAVTTSKSLNVDRSQKEELPTLFTQNIELKSDYLVNSSLTYTRYQFNNIPSVVAFEGSRYGNSTSGTYSSNAKNDYEFKGHLINLKFDYSFKNITANGFFEYINNTKAPTAYSTGKRLGVGLDLHSKGDTYSIQSEIFYNESDTAPAYYNSSLYGHNNREGKVVSLKYHNNQNYSIKLNYIDAKVINQNASQSDQTVLLLELGVLSDLI